MCQHFTRLLRSLANIINWKESSYSRKRHQPTNEVVPGYCYPKSNLYMYITYHTLIYISVFCTDILVRPDLPQTYCFNHVITLSQPTPASNMFTALQYLPRGHWQEYGENSSGPIKTHKDWSKFSDDGSFRHLLYFDISSRSFIRRYTLFISLAYPVNGSKGAGFSPDKWWKCLRISLCAMDRPGDSSIFILWEGASNRGGLLFARNATLFIEQCSNHEELSSPSWQ